MFARFSYLIFRHACMIANVVKMKPVRAVRAILGDLAYESYLTLSRLIEERRKLNYNCLLYCETDLLIEISRDNVSKDEDQVDMACACRLSWSPSNRTDSYFVWGTEGKQREMSSGICASLLWRTYTCTRWRWSTMCRRYFHTSVRKLHTLTLKRPRTCTISRELR